MPVAPSRDFIVVPRPYSAAALVVRREYLIVVPRPMPVAPSRNFIVVNKSLLAAALTVRRRCFIVASRPTS
jgi:hypothetical protein